MYIILVKDNKVVNVDNDNDSNSLVASGWRVLSNEEISSAGMSGYEHLVSPDNTQILSDGTIIFTPPAPYKLPELKAFKLEEINVLYQQAIATLTPTYPDDERLTFDKQEQEARAWLADNSTPTPFIDALAAGRQMEKAELVSRIIAKADAFALASGSLTGQRQRYEDMLDVAETAEAVAAIVPVYSLPGAE